MRHASKCRSKTVSCGGRPRRILRWALQGRGQRRVVLPEVCANRVPAGITACGKRYLSHLPKSPSVASTRHGRRWCCAARVMVRGTVAEYYDFITASPCVWRCPEYRERGDSRRGWRLQGGELAHGELVGDHCTSHPLYTGFFLYTGRPDQD